MDTTSKKLACAIARFLDDKLASDIQILNISHISVMSDFFVIASASSTPQVRGLTQEVRDKVKEHFSILPKSTENDAKNRWNLLDYGDVVVHIMHQEERQTYAIEKFWNHALKINREEWLDETKEFAKYEV